MRRNCGRCALLIGLGCGIFLALLLPAVWLSILVGLGALAAGVLCMKN